MAGGVWPGAVPPWESPYDTFGLEARRWPVTSAPIDHDSTRSDHPVTESGQGDNLPCSEDVPAANAGRDRPQKIAAYPEEVAR